MSGAFDGCPTCPLCDGPGVAHAWNTRGGSYLRCAGCGEAWFASHEQLQAARRFSRAWEARQRRLAIALGLWTPPAAAAASAGAAP